MPPHQPTVNYPASQPLSLYDAFWALEESVVNEMSTVNVLPVVFTSLFVLVAFRWLAPEKFNFIFFYFSLLIIAPICGVLEITLVPVLKFLKRRVNEEEREEKKMRKVTEGASLSS